ncbi:MAG: hypothetical protein A2068_07395 [Ignavibacteria bacterium GWB2_35_6b]|nr:MAG: hypothetical protein A2068_07395 [Ignavibacteria bacterium GWB2_35_6b]
MKQFYKHIVVIIFLIVLFAASNYAQTNQNNSLISVQNYPNPFNLQTQIQFVLSQESDVTVKVFNILGREVKTLAQNKQMSKGSHKIEWNGEDNFGNVVPSGMYLYQIQAENSVLTRKMSLLK